MLTALERRTPRASIVYSFLLQHGVISLSLKPGNAVARGITSRGGDFSSRAAEVVRGAPGGGQGCGLYLDLEGAGEASRLILWIEEGREVK